MNLLLMKLCEHREFTCKTCHPEAYKELQKVKNKKLTKKEIEEFKQAIKMEKL